MLMDTTDNQCSRNVISQLIKWSVDKRGMPVIFSGSLSSLKSIAAEQGISMHNARVLVSDTPRRIPDNSILFFEEQRGRAAEQAKLYKLTMEREIGGYRIPENVSVVIVRDKTQPDRMPKAFANKCFHVVLKDDI